MRAACGIDFGTSNSAVALSDQSAGASAPARMIALQGTSTSVPTALFFSFEDGSTTYGREAMSRYLAREEGRLLRSIKSLLGTQLYDEMTQVKFRRYAFAEIITDFLRFLREAAARELGAPPREVVIGRPAFFVDDDAEADRLAESQLEAAARAAGFETIAFQLEPIAAALHYEQSVSEEEIALVADIGGGTSDFSVVRVSPQLRARTDRRADVLGYNGVHIGGTDFDRQLSMAELMPFLGLGSRLTMQGLDAPSGYFSDLATWHRVNRLYDPKVMTQLRGIHRDSAEPEKIERLIRVVEQRKGHDLLARVERAKIDLSDAPSAVVALADIVDGLALRVRRRRFEESIADHIARIRARIRDVLRLAGIAPGDVRTVFLTGGTSGVPAVRAVIAKVVPSAQLVAGDAFGSVATGLAIDARRRFGA